MKKEGLIIGTLVLLVSNFFIKAMGFSYRVILVRILGTEGIGLVEMVTPIYVFVLVLTTWGIPLAVTKIVAREASSGHWGDVRRVFRLAMAILSISGLLSTILVYVLSPMIISHFTSDSRIAYCLLTMIPAIFIISVCSCYRAYFQGLKQVSAIGFSQFLEQATRVGVGLILAWKLRKYGLEIAITAVSLASVCGELVGLIYMIARFYLKSEKRTGWTQPVLHRRQIFFEMISFSTPVTMTRLLSSLIMALQASLIPRMLLLAGFDLRASTEIYGRFSGVALTLLHLPGIFTMSLAVSILPAVAELTSPESRPRLLYRISESLQISMIFAVPSMMLLFCFAGLLCNILFHVPEAAEPLRILSLGGIFLYTGQTCVSILQGLGKVKTLFVNTLLSGLCLIGGIVLLTPLPALGINGAALAMALSFFVGCSLNVSALILSDGLRLPLADIFIKPIAAGFVSLIYLVLISERLAAAGISSFLSISFLALSGSLIYFVLLFLLGGLRLKAIMGLPFFKNRLAKKWL